ncbi:hypothetical protein D3C81_1590830 [compost metagenome]
MFAHMDDRIGGKGVAQPEMECQVAMRRNQVRVVVYGTRVDLVTACWLDTDERQAIAQPGHHQTAAAEHRVLLGRPPAFQHSLAVGFGQALESGLIICQAQALGAGALVEVIEIVGDAAEQLVNQLGAAVRQFA